MCWTAFLLAFLVACGNGDPQPADAPPLLRLPIAFEISGETPHLLAIRDVPGGSWTVLATNATGMYIAEATHRHQIAMVCGAAGRFATHIEMRVRSDDEPFLFCFNGETPEPTFSVTGQMLQPGQVSMVDFDDSTTAPWMFDLTAVAGPNDLVAFGDTLALVRTSIQITAATTIPAIDLAQGGAAYVNTTAIVANRETDEMMQTELTVFIENGIAGITRSGATLRALPPELLGTGFQFGTIAALTPTTRRDANIGGSGAVNVTLLPRLSGITFAELGSTWTTLPPETTRVNYAAFTPTNSVVLSASGQYLSGDTALSAELDIPGFDAAWSVPAAERVHRFIAYDSHLSQSSVSSAPLPMAARISFDERGRALLHGRGRIARHAPKRAAQLSSDHQNRRGLPSR